MSVHPGASNSGLRWREDTGIEKRCDSCPGGMKWWPLTEDFWYLRQSFVRCKACFVKAKNASNRARSRDETIRQARAEYQLAYRAEARDARAIKSRQAYWADPERYRQAAKARYYRDRDRILARKRLEYWATREEKAA